MASGPKRSWEPKESTATPEAVFWNRRALLAGAGLTIAGGAGAWYLGNRAGSSKQFAAARSPVFAPPNPGTSGHLFPTPRNETYRLDRPITPEEINAAYNNFSEFGSHKKIAPKAQKLITRPWEVTIDGLVEKPFRIAIDDLFTKVAFEERLYRHRCVEAWSMTVPWTGFAMRDLLALARPLSGAKFVRMETFHNPDMASGQRQTWYPWPYIESVTIEEASNELAFLVTGAYGKTLAQQFGAPLRLALPWKYGFKSIKSIVRFEFTDTRPVSFWEELAPKEYGFWANVNPDVPHLRWSQAKERILHTGEKVPTLMYNGYGEQVAHLYAGMNNRKLFM